MFHLERVERWRKLFLPGIFPYLITGFVTASGGAWNASIVAEYFHFRGQTFSTVGLGAVISQATDSGNFRVLLAATMVMADHGGHHQPSALAAALRPGFHPLQARGLKPARCSNTGPSVSAGKKPLLAKPANTSMPTTPLPQELDSFGLPLERIQLP